MAGSILDDFSNTIAARDKKAVTTDTVGLGGKAIPLDGSTSIIYLVRTDAIDDNAWSEPKVGLCPSNSARLCYIENGEVQDGNIYNSVPYIIVYANLKPYIDVMDFGEFQWSTESLSETQLKEREKKILAVMLSDEQRDCENSMLKIVQLLNKVSRMPANFPLSDGTNLRNFVDLVQQERQLRVPTSEFWTVYYAQRYDRIKRALTNQFNARNPPSHQRVRKIISAALDAGEQLSTIDTVVDDKSRDRIETILQKIRRPIDYLKLSGGEIYDSLILDIQYAEKLLQPTYNNLAESYRKSNTKERSALEVELRRRLESTPCTNCRETSSKGNY